LTGHLGSRGLWVRVLEIEGWKGERRDIQVRRGEEEKTRESRDNLKRKYQGNVKKPVVEPGGKKIEANRQKSKTEMVRRNGGMGGKLQTGHSNTFLL